MRFDDFAPKARKPGLVGLSLRAGMAALLVTLPVEMASATPPSPATVAQCAICHAFVSGAPAKIGPNLSGVVGRKAGAVPSYAYSPAMKASGLVWTKPNLDRFIAAPAKTVKGTKMAFPGISDASRRAAIIAYLSNPQKP